MALYDAEIAFNDVQFGVFLEELKRRGLYDDALVVFTSDHGEEFFEHGSVSHGQTLYAEVLNVPFIVKWPRGTGPTADRNPSAAQHIDLLPTILDLLSLPRLVGSEGRSLLRATPGNGRAQGDGILSYLALDGRRLQSASEGRWKLIRRGSAEDPWPPLELFDMETSGETQDLQRQHPIMAAYLLSQLKSQAARTHDLPPPPQAALPDEVKERLRALGYVR